MPPEDPKRDMDERTSIDGIEFEEVLEKMLTDPELPESGEQVLKVVEDEDGE